jgi:hypothetical protein
MEISRLALAASASHVRKMDKAPFESEMGKTGKL